jgi:hypothetical protein
VGRADTVGVGEAFLGALVANCDTEPVCLEGKMGLVASDVVEGEAVGALVFWYRG